MTTIEKLETQNTRAIRRILRRFMGGVDALYFSPSFDRLLKKFSKKYTPDAKKIVLKSYKEGHVDGGRQIRRHLVAAANPHEGVEDPLISKYTVALIKSLSMILASQKEAMIVDLQSWYAAGWTYDHISAGLTSYFDDNPVSANKMARTITNDVFNRATEQRYKDSGVVDGIEFAAHIDARTSQICQMLDGTIWALDDPGIRRPPQHFNCRSRLKPYFGTVPGARDYTKDFPPAFIEEAEETATVFKTKYWDVD